MLPSEADDVADNGKVEGQAGNPGHARAMGGLKMRNGASRVAWVGTLLLLAVAALASHADATQLTTLYNFDGAAHGSNPFGGLTLGGSTLYGMDTHGGANSMGTVFSIPVSGGTPTWTYSFDGAGHGASPWGNLTLGGSTLYGMTYSGGAHGAGTVFGIPVTGGAPTWTYSFDGVAHGGSPLGGLTLSGSVLYGMTTYGGANSIGTVFSIPVTGGTPTTLFNFDGAGHGQIPYGSLTLSGSTLYGMTFGGGANSDGTVFSIPVTGGTPTVLYNFDGAAHGASPYGSLTLGGSTLYGMTLYGGTHGKGTAFSMNTDGTNFQTLLVFNDTNGSNPYGDLTLSGATLYGMTSGGGANGGGTVFSMSTDGTNFQTRLSFNGTNGSSPYGDLTLAGGAFYGMTWGGGTHSDGTVFSLTVPEPATMTLLATGLLGVGGARILRRTKS